MGIIEEFFQREMDNLKRVGIVGLCIVFVDTGRYVAEYFFNSVLWDYVLEQMW